MGCGISDLKSVGQPAPINSREVPQPCCLPELLSRQPILTTYLLAEGVPQD